MEETGKMQKNKFTNIVFIGNSGRSLLTTLGTVIDRELIIPSYQRPYAWAEDHIEDLFNTIRASFESDQEHSKISSKHPVFFGSVIFSSTQDENKYLVIDGQQRVTTFLLILRVIHNNLNDDKSRILNNLKALDQELDKAEKKGDIKKVKDIFADRMKLEKEQDKLDALIKKIENILQKTNISRDSSISKDESTKMESEYIKYITGASFKSSKDFEKNKEKISNRIESIIDDLPFNSSDEYTKYSQIVDYILTMVKFCLLYISGEQSEEYAIDVFNTLNTTGEPLTGFEVFKSKIIQMGRNIGKTQDIENSLFDIESIIKKQLPKRKDIITHTGKLLLYLAIHRDDYQKKILSDKKFKEQNTYINMVLKQNNALEILKDVRNINSFVVENWLPKKSSNRSYSEHLSFKSAVFALKGFDFLRDINHDRVIPVIYKYSKQFLNNKFSIKNYQKIIELCTAFSCLWRMAFNGGASGIDQEYLIIAKKLKNTQNILSAQAIIRKRFENKFSKKESWLEQVGYSELNKNKKITKFLLALMGLKNLSVYSSSDWVSLPICNDRNFVNRFGNIILIPKSKEKEYKNNINQYFPKLLKNDLFTSNIYSGINIDFTREEVEGRTKQLAELVWKKLAIDILNFN